MLEQKIEEIFANQRQNQQDLLEDTCDRYDYLAGLAGGVLGGMVDIFLVGMPQGSPISNWTDQQTDQVVMAFAKISGWKPLPSQADSLANAIKFLEKTFKVNYDQRYGADIGDLFTMSTRNHHMMSLGHSPDILGLFFSILNQFTSTSSFIAEGGLVTVRTDNFHLQGGNFIGKIFCGIANWFGHLMSDMAGSSGSRMGYGRGTGVPIPFYQVFQFAKFGDFPAGKYKQDLATIAIRTFEQGYDFRYGLALGIPVLVTDLSIRLIWALRQYFFYHVPVKACIPTSQNPRLRVMVLVGHASLCLMDGLDAGLKSGGNYLVFFMHLNLIAWYRFLLLVIKEVLIRTGLSGAMQSEVRAYSQVKALMDQYLSDLEKIDRDLFKTESQKYNHILESLNQDLSVEGLQLILIEKYKELEISNPWQGDFDSHMANKEARLKFE